MSRAQLTSTVEQNTGGAVAPFVAGKNKIINGDFRINQRGLTSSGTTSALAYTLDRWEHYATSGTPTVSVQNFTLGTAPVSGYESTQFYRCNTSGVGTASGDGFAFQQNIEGVRVFAGQTATVSFWCKTASGTPNIGIALEQYCGTGGSDVLGIGATVALTGGTAWTRYSVTFSVPSLSGKTMGTAGTDYLALYFILSAGSSRNAIFGTSAGQTANTFDFWGIQFENGPVATPFTTATGTLSGELGACQRYYWQTAWNTSGATTIMVSGIGIGSTQVAQAYCAHPVTMRAIPSAALNGTSNMVFYNGAGGGTTFAISAIASQNSSTIAGTLSITTSGTTANVVYNLLALTAGNGYISFSAEL